MISSLSDQLYVSFLSLLYVAIVFFWMWVAKKAADFTSSVRADHEISNRNNLAVGMRRAGLYLGTGIGVLGPVLSATGSLASQFVQVMVDGAMVTIFMIVAIKLNDIFIVPYIDNDESVKNGNTAVGVVEMGSYLATGLIAYNSFSGQSGLVSSIVFFALGQAVLIVAAKVFSAMAPFDMIGELRKGNASAGLILGGTLFSLGIILNACLSGPFVGWVKSLQGFFVYAALGIALLMVILKVIVEKVFLSGTSLRQEVAHDQNVAAATLTVASLVTVALVLANTVI